MRHYDVIILGAGAAGLMCAIQAGRRGRRTLLLDHADRVGKKILISGGGRCNFTNLHARPENFLSQNPHFARSALARYTPADFIALVESHKIPYHEKTLGQLFCDRSAKEIVAMLERECSAANVRIQTNTQVLAVERSRQRSAEHSELPSEAQPETRPEETSEARSEGRFEGRPKAGTEAHPDGRFEAGTEARPEERSEAGAEARPEGRSEAPGFRIHTSHGDYTAESLVVATGGLSIPKMGATGFGYEIARQFHLNIVEPRPGLVPLVLSPQDQQRWCDLTGLSAEVIAAANGPAATDGAFAAAGTAAATAARATSAAARPKRTPRSRIPAFREKMLITHRGLSGPAILQASSYWHPGESITLDLAPDAEVFSLLLERNARRDPAVAEHALRGLLPGRLAERWVTNHPPANWTNAGLAAAEQHLHHWTLTPAGTEGFAKAEVTVGGVDTAGLDARTMESRTTPGLFFIGEVVDVTGWLGGYNFQWAWASGYSAGQSA